MYKKIIALFVAMLLAAVAYAIDVNSADEAALRSVKGIGPATAKQIVAERDAHGPFKDFADLAARIKGLGDKKVEKLKAAGLTVGPDDGKQESKAKKD